MDEQQQPLDGEVDQLTMFTAIVLGLSTLNNNDNYELLRSQVPESHPISITTHPPASSS